MCLFVSTVTYANEHQIKEKIFYIIDESNDKISLKEKEKIFKSIIKYSKKYEISPLLIAAIISKESNFKKDLIQPSSKCVGLMQVNKKYHLEKLKILNIKNEDLTNIDENINLGVFILKEHIDQQKGNLKLGLLHFNGVVKNKKRGNYYISSIFNIINNADKIKG